MQWLRWLLVACVATSFSLASNARAQQAPAEGSDALDAPAEEDDEEGVPVVEQQPGQEGPVIVVEQQPGTVPPGYESQPMTPVPQPGQPTQPLPAPAGDPSYGQPGYGQAPGYGQTYERPRYHREPYVEGMQLPPDAQIVGRARKGLVIPGIPMFAASYLGMVFTYIFADIFGDPPETMLIPLVGPFFLMPDASSEGRTFLGLDALLQIGGVTMLILGLTLKKKYVVWYGDSGVRVRPLASRRGGGLQLAYSF